jgi:anti-sigma regulatory factor (Ser/Thr protein kinase)
LWEHAVTEVLNNAKDHSGGAKVYVQIKRNAFRTSVSIADDGVGILAKLQAALDLPDQRMAALELAKGKLTTDPANHSGEGIFFSTRMTDGFTIRSGTNSYTYTANSGFDWVEEEELAEGLGTMAVMVIDNHTARSRSKVFAQFQSTDGELRFNRTTVPVSLAKIGQADLISRSQAKRLMSRLDRFEIVELDFAGVEEIGQGFADEAFRVYVNAHPSVQLIHKNANKQVLSMIEHVKNSAPKAPAGAKGHKPQPTPS